MKFILYILLCLLLNVIMEPIDDELNFLACLKDLNEEYFNSAEGTDIYSAFTFYKEKPVAVPLSKVISDKTTLHSPYLISTIFKLEKMEASCLFSIEEEGITKLRLGLIPAYSSVTRILIESDSITNGTVSFLSSLINPGSWIKLLLHVDRNRISLMTNCMPPEIVEYSDSNKVKDIHVSKKAMLYLSHSNTATKEFFTGSIQEIKIHPNVFDITDNHMCTEHDLPDSGYEDTETDEHWVPENLTMDFKIPLEKGEKGDMGEKGDVGASITGPQGSRGPPGPQGPPGTPGRNGLDGKCECSESVVSNLIKSMPEIRGLPGERGPRGEVGDPGPTGLTGKPGEQGARGPPGLKGQIGERGDDGSPGRDGTPGLKGEPGNIGEPGPPGAQGPMGPPGLPGPGYKDTEDAKEISVPGEKGDVGPIGPPGSPGPEGAQGEKGEKGQQGDKGDRGHKGDEGSRGEKGERGESGRDGIPGSPGTHGTPAEKGEKGDRGENGSPGPPGTPAKLTSLLDPDVDPAESSAIVNKLRGLKGETGMSGEKGDKGDVGLIGPQGLPGKDGRHGRPGEKGLHGPRGEPGPIGTPGPKGERGEPGPPGIVTTSAVTVTKGPKGDPGPPGKTGPHGPKGRPGKTGATGRPGPKGDAGSSGPMGPVGPQGEKGSSGEKGDCQIIGKGEKGDKGDSGSAGPPGKQGPPGPPSSLNAGGYVPVPGLPGPPGPPGPPGTSITGPKGEPGGIIAQKTYYSFTNSNSGDPNDEEDFYTAVTVIYKTTTALVKRTSTTPLGTLAYVLREKILLLRVESGWQHVVMGSLLEAKDRHSENIQYTTNTIPKPIMSPSSASIREMPPREASVSYIRLAALNQPYTGRMYSFTNRTGRNAADLDCYRESKREKVGGTFVAFLANKVEDLKSIVKNNRDRRLPVVNLQGEVLFDSWSDMFNGSGAVFASSTSNIYSFNGKNVLIDPTWPKKAVWHGGNSYGIRSPKAFCKEWQTDNPKFVGAASSLQSNKLLQEEMYPCNSNLIVLCVEVTSNTRRRQRHPISRRRSQIQYFTPVPFDNRIPGI